MIKNGRIDIIIPAYNVSDELLFSCLSSIATQNLKDLLKVTIVDDASIKENYKDVIKHFSHFLDIQILRLKNNGGPGVARQYGIDNTNNEYIVFIDADDLLASGFALDFLKQILDNNDDTVMAVGQFQEPQFIEDNELMVHPHFEDLVWVFGKMYRRSFMKSNIIFF